MPLGAFAEELAEAVARFGHFPVSPFDCALE